MCVCVCHNNKALAWTRVCAENGVKDLRLGIPPCFNITAARAYRTFNYVLSQPNPRVRNTQISTWKPSTLLQHTLYSAAQRRVASVICPCARPSKWVSKWPLKSNKPEVGMWLWTWTFPWLLKRAIMHAGGSQSQGLFTSNIPRLAGWNWGWTVEWH